MVKIQFQNCEHLHFVHRVTFTVHVDRGTRKELDWGSALRHGLVLNHPLGTMCIAAHIDWNTSDLGIIII